MNLRLAGTFGIWILACVALPAADFWEDKDYTSWSEEEVQEMLSDSPWSRAVTVVVGRAGGRSSAFQNTVVGDGDDDIRVVPDDESSTGASHRRIRRWRAYTARTTGVPDPVGTPSISCPSLGFHDSLLKGRPTGAARGDGSGAR